MWINWHGGSHAVRHNQLSVGDSDQERWTPVGSAMTGIQVLRCVDTCTPGHTLWTKPGRWHSASEVHVAGTASALDHTCRCWRQSGPQHWGHAAACQLSSLAHQSRDETAALVDPASDERVDERGAAELSSRERLMRRSCRSWKKHLALTAVTCLSRDRSGVNRTPRTRVVSNPTTWTPPSVRERQQITITV